MSISRFEDSLRLIDSMSQKPTDGLWLEDVTIKLGASIREWDLHECFSWSDWPERQEHFPGLTKKDLGIDVVGSRENGAHVAIQCKSRQLNERGRGQQITKTELDSFLASTQHEIWEERWLVTNGDNPLAPNAQEAQKITPNAVKMVNIHRDVEQEFRALKQQQDASQDERNASKTRMQVEAVEQSVAILQKHFQSNSGGLPKGQARGRLILPCGAGKTRVSLRIVEELTDLGQLSVVLCPSIALVSQIRREYLQFRKKYINALAVCSDQSAGVTKKDEGRLPEDDPTLDTSFVSATEIKGRVTTDVDEIAAWLNQHVHGQQGAENRINIVFGTYQSASRVAEAIAKARVEIEVLVADEAHRTAGIRKAKTQRVDDRIRDFTLCHDQSAFPAKFRVYQTATPRVYSYEKSRQVKKTDWVVRTMDDETIFGVELYRRSYVDAVKHGWLSDYRIIAIGVNDVAAFEQANKLASVSRAGSVAALKTAHYLRGLAFALAMSGATRSKSKGSVKVGSCIAFMNTIKKSENMARSLNEEGVRTFIEQWFKANGIAHGPAPYRLRHLDAKSNVTTRQEALRELDRCTVDDPRGILNVGIFGEGTDSPALNAVAFLEPRRSPIDVIQAVGRAMRTAPGKDIGYIICPILIPANSDPETWLSNTGNMEDGWQELGEILLALRAHDGRIETDLAHLIDFYLPANPSEIRTLVAIAEEQEGEHGESQIHLYEHEGKNGTIYGAVTSVVEKKTTSRRAGMVKVENRSKKQWKHPEPTQIVTAKLVDGNAEIRVDDIQRAKTKDGSLGAVDLKKSKKRAIDMINKAEGRKYRPKQGDAQREIEGLGLRLVRLSGMGEHKRAIQMNLLEQSGLKASRVERDLNILEESVQTAATHLLEDHLEDELAKHYGLDKLTASTRRANASTVASLILMNAAMMHQRIDATGFIETSYKLAEAKNHPDVIHYLTRAWERIMRTDYQTVFEPAVEILDTVKDKTQRRGGLERALHHIASEAERIAETYANMGMDHAGPLFNRVMGDQASDGAFFTRPLAAVIAASLALDLYDEIDWRKEEDWERTKIVDLACGSGTLLAATLADMRRRAREAGASSLAVGKLHRAAVEHSLKGFDINPVSLQLAAAQLSIGNSEIRFNRMGLYRMPYGQSRSGSEVSAGSLELLGQSEIVKRPKRVDQLNVEDIDQEIHAEEVWQDDNQSARLDSAVDAVKNARVVIMNPPFTNRAQMGEKFSRTVQHELRKRADGLENGLVAADPEMEGFMDKNSIRPLFVALADHCLDDVKGVLSMINPTIALSSTSGINERRLLAKRFHIHTVVTCHLPGQINMSQNTNINESIVVARRHEGARPDTRFVHLDRFPMTEKEALELCSKLRNGQQLDEGWGEVSYWPADRMIEGDWSPAIWRDPELAQVSRNLANHPKFVLLNSIDRIHVHKTGASLLTSKFQRAKDRTHDCFPVLKSKGADAQCSLRARPDEYWVAANGEKHEHVGADRGKTYQLTESLLRKAGFLLVTAGQDLQTARLTAVASDCKYVGVGWMPVTGISFEEAKALSLFLNSTAGRLQLFRSRGRKLSFPLYNPKVYTNLMVPDIRQDSELRTALANCYDETQHLLVPQFREGECEVRVEWDRCVCKAMGWDQDYLRDALFRLHREPVCRGLGRNQYREAPTDT